MKRSILGSMILIVLLSLSLPLAAVPGQVNYRGKLFESGNPVTGTRSMEFRIYDALSLGNMLWTSGNVSLDISQGLYNYTLGTNPAISSAVFTNDKLYLEVRIAGTPLSPRERLVTVPYSFNSDTVDGRHANQISPFKSTNGWQIIQDNQGAYLGLGTRNPGYAVDVKGGSGRSTYLNLNSDDGMGNGDSAGIIVNSDPAGGGDFAGIFLNNNGAMGTALYGAGTSFIGSSLGVGASTWPSYTLDVYGTARMTGFLLPLATANGYVLTSDASGNGTWQTLPSRVGGAGTRNYIPKFSASTTLANSIMIETNNRIGIGTIAPNDQLELTGNLRLPVTTAAAGILMAGASRFLHNYGTANTFLGIYSGNVSLTGTYNTGIGYYALNSLGAGAYNTAVGAQAQQNATGSYNTSVGWYSMISATGGYNAALGYYTGRLLSSGINNIMLGAYTGYSLTTGQNNIFLGYQSGYNLVGGSRNVFIGYQAGMNETGSDKLYIANSGASFPLVLGDFNANILAVNGNLGVGTTSPQAPGAGARSIVVQAANFPQHITYSSNAAAGNKIWRFIGRNDGSAQIQTLDDSYAGENTILGMMHNGDVGVGTIGPIARLQVNNSYNSKLFINNDGPDGYAYLSLGQEWSEVMGLVMNGDLVQGELWTGTSWPFVFNIGGSERMRIDGNTGYVGIGTAGPSQRLSVNGNLTADNYQYNAPKTYYARIPACDFQATGGSANGILNSTGYIYVSAVVPIQAALKAVPNGAFITTIYFYAYNNAGSTTFTCALQRRADTALNYSTLYSTAPLLNPSGSIQTISLPVNTTIDLLNYEYVIYASWTTTGSSVGLYGVKVAYTMSQVGN